MFASPGIGNVAQVHITHRHPNNDSVVVGGLSCTYTPKSRDEKKKVTFDCIVYNVKVFLFCPDFGRDVPKSSPKSGRTKKLLLHSKNAMKSTFVFRPDFRSTSTSNKDSVPVACAYVPKAPAPTPCRSCLLGACAPSCTVCQNQRARGLGNLPPTQNDSKTDPCFRIACGASLQSPKVGTGQKVTSLYRTCSTYCPYCTYCTYRTIRYTPYCTYRACCTYCTYCT